MIGTFDFADRIMIKRVRDKNSSESNPVKHDLTVETSNYFLL